jgi:flagellar protein FlaG
MIVQNTNQGGQPARRVRDDVPTAAADPPRAVASEPSSGSLAAEKISVQQLQTAVHAINQAMQTSNSHLRFSVDQSTERLVVQVVDVETGDLIRQIPSQETLNIANTIDLFLQKHSGVLLSQKV